MSEEEKEAITTLKDIKEKRFYTHAFDYGTLVLDDDEIECVETILNLIEKQHAEIIETKEANRQLSFELENKDKIIKKINLESQKYFDIGMDLQQEIYEKDAIIDLMAEQLTTPVNTKKWVVEYYTNKAKEIINT